MLFVYRVGLNDVGITVRKIYHCTRSELIGIRLSDDDEYPKRYKTHNVCNHHLGHIQTSFWKRHECQPICNF